MIGKTEQTTGNPGVNASDRKDPAQIRATFVKGIMDKIHGDDFDSEEDRMAFENKIEQKIKSGAKLSQEDSAKDGDDNAISYSFGSGGYQEAVTGGTTGGAIFQVGA